MKDADYVLVDLTNAAIAAQALLTQSGGAYLALKKADKARRALNAPISAATQIIWSKVKPGHVVKVLYNDVVLGPADVKTVDFDNGYVTLTKGQMFNMASVQLISHEEPCTET